MKKYLLLSMFISVTASAGDAVIPYWSLYAAGNTCFSVSNLSSSPMTFKVTLFEQNGQKYTGAIQSNVGISALDTDTNLAGHNSAQFCLTRFSTNKFGYGLISTTTVDGAPNKAFAVARGWTVNHSSINHSSTISINNGLPF